MIHFDPALDLFPLVAAMLAAVSCALLGNFLVLRRISLMGDAISHSVLPGLVVAFLISATRDPVVMFVGAACAGLLTIVLVELVKRLGRVEPGAAMGVVFSLFFALGVLLIERAAVSHIDLDADCVLYGQLETLVWFDAPASTHEFFSIGTLAAAPRQVVTLTITCLLTAFFVVLLFKELRIASFNAQLATTLGFNASLLHYALMTLVAIAAVASFEAVGSILVIAMLICPAAGARLMTDRLVPQVVWSVIFALASSTFGYFGATAVPAIFDADSVNAAGSITVASGVFLACAIFFAPAHGVLAKSLRRGAVADRVALENLLAAIYRAGKESDASAPIERVRDQFANAAFTRALAIARRRDLVWIDGETLVLTEHGLEAAEAIVRRHRLWESYLVDRAGLAPDHVHEPAEQLEHVRVSPESGPPVDPHGKPIPRRQ
ncbi:MAG: metal ABC transporter permease [Planctomycetota bacterium]